MAPPKRPTQAMSDEFWREIGTPLESIYTLRETASNLITTSFYNKLRMSAYSFCRSSPPYSTTTTRPISTSLFGHGRNSDHPVPDLYLNLDNFLTNFTRHIFEDLSYRWGENLLREYSKGWTAYKKSSEDVAKIFDDLSTSLSSSFFMGYYKMAIQVWEREIIRKTFRKITTAALCYVDRGRDGLELQRNLVNDFVVSLVAIGSHETGDYNVEYETYKQVIEVFKTLSTVCRYPLYRELFLKPLLHQTYRYYVDWSTNFLKDGEFSEYLELVKLHFLEEESFCGEKDPCFDLCTLVPLCMVCADALVMRHIDRFYSEFVTFLNDLKIEKLLIIYDLCNRIPSTIDKLKELLGKYFARVGLKTINQIADKAEKSPKLFVGTIVQLHDNFSKLVKDSFRTNNEFMTTMEVSFTEFVAENNITNGGKTEAKSSRLIASYYDQLLRKGIAAEERLSGLEKAIIACKYIRDKDTFNDHYQKLLCKRLIYHLSVGIETEKEIVSKLREKFQCPRVFDSMLTETLKSEIEMEDFKKEDNNSLPVLDFSVILLTEKVWPFPSTSNFSLPTQLNDYVNAFSAFYKKKYKNKRKLSWIYQVSRGELSSLDGTFNKKYVFLCTTQQITILMLYNKYDSCKINKIAAEIKLPNNQIMPLLQVLCKTNLLIEKDSGNFCLNNEFKSENTKIDLIRAVATTNTGTQRKGGEVQKLKRDVFRESVLETVIVRIMKARKKLKHDELVSEVTSQLNSRFVVKSRMIKSSIEQLIKEDYLKRSENDNNLYEYIEAVPEDEE
uniref:Cullin family profile domain-containing protein n=1 Tax=Meloidogyne incognita TaxID=6306 RepID=A0A914L2P1_MELIC